MSKIILHNGRCGSTYLYLVLDRYYRAKEGDNSKGSFESIYERQYDLDNCNYVGLNEYLVPEIIDTTFYNDALWIWRNKGKAKENVKNNLHEVMYTTMSHKDCSEKQSRRKIIDDLIKNQRNVLLKYPLLTNPKPQWDVDYISCERKDIEKQTTSLYLSMTTGYYHFKPGDEKIIKRYKKFAPQQKVLDRWITDMKMSWKFYQMMKPKKCQTVYMEDFEDLKPFEVLEMLGMTDWGNYLNKDFNVPIRKAWHSEDTTITKRS